MIQSRSLEAREVSDGVRDSEDAVVREEESAKEAQCAQCSREAVKSIAREIEVLDLSNAGQILWKIFYFIIPTVQNS